MASGGAGSVAPRGSWGLVLTDTVCLADSSVQHDSAGETMFQTVAFLFNSKLTLVAMGSSCVSEEWKPSLW